MEIVEVFVEYPSGLIISDRATYVRELDHVCTSERLASVLREFSVTESPPEVTATIDGAFAVLRQVTDGSFKVESRPIEAEKRHPGLVLRVIGHEWTKEQRQQFGRYVHTLSAASIAGAVGYWHAVPRWTIEAVLSEAALLLLFVVLFFTGMDSMNGD
jgi:hypothetical protein